MQLGEMTFGTNIKIPERQEGGSYELADYTLGYFGAGVAAFIRKDIHSLCRFGNGTEYVGSDLDKRMTEIYNSYPDEFKELMTSLGMSTRSAPPTFSARRSRTGVSPLS